MLKNFLKSNFGFGSVVDIFLDPDNSGNAGGAPNNNNGNTDPGSARDARLNQNNNANAGTDNGGEGSSKATVTFSGALVEKKDPVSGDMIKIPIELEPFFGHVISSTRNSIEGQYKPMVEKLQNESAELSDVRAELQKIKEASMTAEEKATANAQRKIAEYETKAKNASEESVKWKGRFFDTMITNDIFGAFGDIKLCNPQQTAILFQKEGKAQVESVLDASGQPTEHFQTKIFLKLRNETTGLLENVEGTPKELFKRWVNQEDNLHHQLNNLASGGNSSAGKGRNGGVDYMSLSAEERLARAPRERS